MPGFGGLGLAVMRIGLEAGPLSQWLHAGLPGRVRGRAAGDPARQGGAVGDDGQDRPQGCPRHRAAAADGLVPAGALQVGAAQEVRALLVGRKLLQGKLRDVELSIRGILRGFGLKVGEVSKGRFEARIRELVAGHAMLETVTGRCWRRASAAGRVHALHREMLEIARTDRVCHRLMTAPGVGEAAT